MLYEKAVTAKEDKTLKLYEGMYLSMINVEPDKSMIVKDGYQWRKYGQKVTRNWVLLACLLCFSLID
ncbi:hypothetical protein L2E82_47041 [Cichorium intybus]|uniref:Uncharacterized protein n=1 Tax=Cichorium intybus TaxID=13427 RepID=A0ACB8YUX2_CICIN|nr:hypothetical protein L2E82_47041 [Cichorium intybus]